MEEEGHVCEAPWDHGVGQWGRTLMPCVWWYVVPAGFASGRRRGYLAAGDAIWSGKSLTGTMLAFYWTFFFFSFFFFLGLPEKDYVLIIKMLNVQCCTTCPKN